MVKAPSKHGLERKFKPWRKGKSAKSNKRSSLKQQLRGLQRLLGKLNGDDEKGNDIAKRRSELQEKIQALEGEIDSKQKVIQQKKNAEQSHGRRFLERQKLTRQEKKVQKQLAAAAAAAAKGTTSLSEKELEAELYKIALDQVYVAHHPADVKYMPLFNKNGRVVDVSRQLYRRAVTRRRILKELLADGSTTERVSWISADQYARLLSKKKEWTIQDEEGVFGGTISRANKKEVLQAKQQTDDSRFALSSEHSALLEAAETLELELNETEEKEKKASEDNDNSSSSDSDDSSSSGDEEEDNADPMIPKTDSHPSKEQPKARGDDSGSSSSSDSSDSDSDSSSDSDSDSSDDEGEVARSKLPQQQVAPEEEEEEEEEEQDDFLLDDVETDNTNVFEHAKEQLPGTGTPKGDKSRGWETQKQRPGQFKRKRQRR